MPLDLRAVATNPVTASHTLVARSASRVPLEPPPAWFYLGLVGVAGVSLAIQLTFIHAVSRTAKLAGDASYYARQAKLLVEGHWFVDPNRFEVARVFVPSAAHPPLATLTLAVADVAGATSFTSHMVFLGLLFTVAVVVGGLAGRQLAGPLAGVLSALVMATYPELWVNPSVVTSETLAILAVTLLLWGVLRFWRAPTRRTAAEIGVYLALAALARSELALLVLLVGAPLVLRCRWVPWKRRVGFLVVMVFAFGLLTGPWVGRNLATFHQAELLSDQGGATLAVSNCRQTYSGPLEAWWDQQCILHVPLPAHSDESDSDVLYRNMADHYVTTHPFRAAEIAVLRVGRVWGLYHPSQQAVLEQLDGRPEWVSTIGFDYLYALMPLALAGVVILRCRRSLVFPLVAMLVMSTATVALTFGDSRYRVEADTALAILAAVALDALLISAARIVASRLKR